MNSYNKIEKFKYSKGQQDPVALYEYIIFDDERKHDKVTVFKFHNNLDQVLEEIRFEVSEYDENNHLICQTIVHYNDFKTGANEDFVPSAKFKLKYETKELGVKLIFARFYKVTWENNVYTPIPYSFKDAMKEKRKVEKNPKLNKIEKLKASVKPNNIIQEKEEEKKIKKSKNTYQIKDIIKKNKAKLPKVLDIVFVLLCVVFVLITTISFSSSYNAFQAFGQDYAVFQNKNAQLISSKDGDVKNYKEQTIPEKIVLNKTGFNGDLFKSKKGDSASLVQNLKIIKTVEIEYKITGIASKAFDNSKVEKVTIKSKETVIFSQAFYNCKKLSKVTGYCRQIQPNAFEGCSNLSYLDLEGAHYTKNSLKGLEGCLNTVKIGTIALNEVSSPYQLFGLDDNSAIRDIQFLIPRAYQQIFLGLNYNFYD